MLLTPGSARASEIPPGPEVDPFIADTPTKEGILVTENLTPPMTIRVRVTGKIDVCDPFAPYTVETVDFNYYVKHVLPSEWEAGWPEESYRAGAMAVKMYAWYWISHGGKWSDADVTDSVCDQVYNPNITRDSTNRAVDYTWNWALTRSGQLFETRHKHSDQYGCTPPTCMSQIGSRDLAYNGYTWDEILFYYYTNSILSPSVLLPAGFALRFNGQPGDYGENRLLIAVDDPTNNEPGSPVDIGSEDFTIEWWMKATASENISNHPIICGPTQDWVYGNILLDRSRFEVGSSYGVSLYNGKLVFGVTGQGPISNTESLTLCGMTTIADDHWHHISIQRQRSDGHLWIFVDGKLEASTDGPDGDISYPDDAVPARESDSYLGIGAWKLDDDQHDHPFYRGWIDELRFSNVLRYSTPFTPTQVIFTFDGYTVALYHFDEGYGDIIHDTSDAFGGPSDGKRYFGGTVNGPEWWPSYLFTVFRSLYLPIMSR